jgi:hypothetical protein
MEIAAREERIKNLDSMIDQLHIMTKRARSTRWTAAAGTERLT